MTGRQIHLFRCCMTRGTFPLRAPRHVVSQLALFTGLILVLLTVPTTASATLWPTQGILSSDFGPRAGRLHRGIDIAAPVGSAVVAISESRVIAVGDRGDYGLLVELEHGAGWVSRYAHLSSAAVEVGDVLEAGAVLGEVGSSGNATGPHLHFEVRLDGESVDPFEVLP